MYIYMCPLTRKVIENSNSKTYSLLFHNVYGMKYFCIFYKQLLGLQVIYPQQFNPAVFSWQSEYVSLLIFFGYLIIRCFKTKIISLEIILSVASLPLLQWCHELVEWVLLLCLCFASMDRQDFLKCVH